MGQVAAAGKRFAFMKASEGSTMSTRPTRPTGPRPTSTGSTSGRTTSRSPTRAGRRRPRGGPLPRDGAVAKGDLLPVLDLEVAGGLDPVPAPGLGPRLPRADLRADRGPRRDLHVARFWVKYAGDTSWFADNGYKVLWIAHWTTARPRPCRRMRGAGTAGRSGNTRRAASVTGISGRVDLDRYNGTDFAGCASPKAGTRW